MSDDWKEIEDCNQDCNSENGWCGFCWRCMEHHKDLQQQEEWDDE